MRIPGRKMLLYAGRYARSRLVRHGIILGYHRINTLPQDPFRMATTPEHFAEHLAVLQEHARVIPLADLAAAPANGGITPRSVAITFDDGYSDFLPIARPMLERAGMPSTLFVATGYLGREFWWDRLVRLVAAINAAQPLQLTAGSRRFDWQPGSTGAATDNRRLLDALHAFLLPLMPAERADFMEQLVTLAPGCMPPAPGDLACTEAEISDLARDPLITIGCHTVSHSQLARLGGAAQRAELTESRQHLQDLTGSSVDSFSFPHGSVNTSAEQLVRSCGFSHACDSRTDVVWRHSNPFRLPRIWIPDCDGAAFRRLLEHWL